MTNHGKQDANHGKHDPGHGKHDAERPPLSRLVGAGARAGDRLAQATGLDAALDQAIEEAIVRAFRSQALRHALERALTDKDPHEDIDPEELAWLVRQVMKTEAVSAIWAEVLASEQVQMLVERIADAPEVRAAITQQGAGLITDIGVRLTRITEAIDDAIEKIIRPKSHDAETDQAGLATRALAGAVDFGLLFLIYTLGSAIISSVEGGTVGGKFSFLAIVIISGLAVMAGAATIVAFWALVGQTPGMRFLSIKLVHRGSHEIGPRRAIVRWLVLVLTGGFAFVWIAFSPKRRGLHDMAAGTEVIYQDLKTAPYSGRDGGSGRGRASDD